MKSDSTHVTGYRCDICRRPVDHEIDTRAHRGWHPLVVCDRCVRDAPPSLRTERLAA